jgi:flagellar protein FliL
MLRKLVPVLLAVFGLVAGAGAGLLLRPSSAPAPAVAEDDAHGADDAKAAEPAHGEPEETGAATTKDHGGAAEDGHAAPAGKEGEATHDYVKLNNQFVVPVVQNGRVAALVILSISLEVAAGSTEKVYKVEPKLRDGFLQVMFDHANAGGFMGTFTDGSNMVLLREALGEVARSVLGPDVTDVLIVDIVRQDN